MWLGAGVEFAMLRTVHYAILLLGVYVGLATINVPMGAILGVFAVLGVGIGFGLQNLASNFISGVILLFERPVKVGDRITVDDVWGNVVQINLRTTVVNTVDNTITLITDDFSPFALSAVPVPPAIYLFGAALAAIGCGKRRGRVVGTRR